MDTVDAFLDGDITYDDADGKIDTLTEQFETEDDPVGGTLSTLAEILSFKILKMNAGASSVKGVEEKRDEFADRIGK